MIFSKLDKLNQLSHSSNIEDTVFISWAHFLPNMPHKSNSKEIGENLVEMSRNNRLVIAIDGLGASFFRDVNLANPVVINSAGMQDILCEIPDGSIVVAADPTDLHETLDNDQEDDFEVYLNAFATYAPTEYKELQFLLRISPALAALLYAAFSTDARNINRRSVLKIIGLVGFSAAYLLVIERWYSFAKEIQREKSIAQSNRFNDNHEVIAKDIKTPFGINERVVMSLDKLNYAIEAIKVYQPEISKNLKPVAIFGSSHFLDDDYQGFKDTALRGNQKKRLVSYALSQQKESLLYDLLHTVVLIKQTDKETGLASLQGYNIPWVGSVISTNSVLPFYETVEA